MTPPQVRNRDTDIRVCVTLGLSLAWTFGRGVIMILTPR
jgi:hypothetical protein